MKRTIAIKIMGLVMLLVPLLLSFIPGAVYAQWTRLALDEGGVGLDVQQVRLSDNSLGNIVWSANMEGGFFRAEWGDINGWGTWTEYLPGRFAYGVDAIKLGTTEHVLAATGTMGIWYEDNPPTSGEWQRPHGESQPYPENWEQVWTFDAAFYCDANGNFGVTTPQDSFFVILVDTVDIPGTIYDQNPGIYRWSGIPSPDNYFTRVDKQYNWDASRGFANFWRDLEEGNVLYVTSPDGIYKLYGAYTNLKFEKLPPQTKLEDLPVDLPQDLLRKLPALTQRR